METKLNGWNLEQTEEAIEGVRETPEAGRLTWRSRVHWDGGFGVDVRTEEIEQLGESMPRRFTLRGDHPPQFLGHNTGPTSIEAFLSALGSCLAGTFAAQATARGVHLDRLEIDLQGVIDLNGFFGLRPVAPGLSNLQVTLRVESDAEEDVLEEILGGARSHSPIFDSVTLALEVDTEVTRS